jgi:hypothetical protein
VCAARLFQAPDVPEERTEPRPADAPPGDNYKDTHNRHDFVVSWNARQVVSPAVLATFHRKMLVCGLPGRGSVPHMESLQEQAAFAETPFDSIESAHQFLTLLTAHVAGVRTSLADDVAEAARANARRRLDALRLVEYKLTQLDQHLSVAVRLLNDLRALRRLLLGERNPAVVFDVPAASHDVR